MYAQGNSGWAWFGTASGKLLLALLIAAVLAALYTCLPWRFTGSQADKAVSRATEIMGDVATAAELEREQPSSEKRGGSSLDAREPGIYAGGVRLEPSDGQLNLKTKSGGGYFGLVVFDSKPYDCTSGLIDIVFRTDDIAAGFDPAATPPGQFLPGPTIRAYPMEESDRNGVLRKEGVKYRQVTGRGGGDRPAKLYKCQDKTVTICFPGMSGMVAFNDPNDSELYYFVELPDSAGLSGP